MNQKQLLRPVADAFDATGGIYLSGGLAANLLPLINGRHFLDELTADVDPENAWKRLKPRKHTAKYLAVFKAVAAWRERTAQQRDQPRGRILKDEAIDEIAAQAPTDPDAFNRLRSVPKGFGASRLGLELSAELKRVLADPEAHAPKLDRPAHNQPAPPSVVELLKVLLKAKSDNAGVASKLIATVSDLEKIAVDDNAKVEALTAVNAAQGADKALIESVRVFDQFTGDKAEAQMGAGKKSIALTVRLQPGQRADLAGRNQDARGRNEA